MKRPGVKNVLVPRYQHIKSDAGNSYRVYVAKTRIEDIPIIIKFIDIKTGFFNASATYRHPMKIGYITPAFSAVMAKLVTEPNKPKTT